MESKLKHCGMEPRLQCLCVALAIAMASTVPQALGQCGRQCDFSLVYFNVSEGADITYIRSLFDDIPSLQDISSYNPMDPPISQYYIKASARIRIRLPSCSCRRLPDGTRYLGLVFNYTVLQGDTYSELANNVYDGLTTPSWLQTANTIPASSLQPGNVLNISINCSCGDPKISEDYGLFMTYPLKRAFNDTLANISSTVGVPADLIRRYNPNVDFNNFSGIAFIPVQDNSGSYRPFGSGSGGGEQSHPLFRLAIGAIIGICIDAVVLVIIALGFYSYKRKKAKMALLLQPPNTNANELQSSDSEPFPLAGKVDLTVEKSVEFTYEELAFATNNFSLANKIGQGGSGAVYYGEVRGEKAAIKRMDMEATHEFMAELKVLTHVHHLNLVHLIGFCTEESLFLVYEFIDNGNLSQHLRGSAMQPLSWAARVQIALGSARGLEYIHEHTMPMYIHRDIKSTNILIDKNFRPKVADFGLTKLTEAGGPSASLQTRLAGTFGYMPPEYAQFGDVSPKADVYAFGVVLYEIISAKEAVIRTNETFTESKGLVALILPSRLPCCRFLLLSVSSPPTSWLQLQGRRPQPLDRQNHSRCCLGHCLCRNLKKIEFKNVWEDSDGHEALKKLIDTRLENYPLESVWKMATLAKACTQENPELRPNMRTVVVALMMLSSFEEWDVGSIRENKE